MLLPGANPWARRPGGILRGATPRPTPTCRRGLPALRTRGAARAGAGATRCTAYAREAEAAPRAPRVARRTWWRTARLAATTPRVPSDTDTAVVADGAAPRTATTATTATTAATPATPSKMAGKAPPPPPPPPVDVITGVITHRPLSAHRAQPLLLRIGPSSRTRRRRRRKLLRAALSTRWRRSSTHS